MNFFGFQQAIILFFVATLVTLLLILVGALVIHAISTVKKWLTSGFLGVLVILFLIVAAIFLAFLHIGITANINFLLAAYSSTHLKISHRLGYSKILMNYNSFKFYN